MKVPYGEGVACRTGPAPCVVDRVGKTGRRNGCGRYGEPVLRLDVVRDPRHASTLFARKPGGRFTAHALRGRAALGRRKPHANDVRWGEVGLRHSSWEVAEQSRETGY